MSSPLARPDIAVIIPCRNGSRYLPACLQSLLVQDLDRSWEVVIVDNGSTDTSAAIARSYAGTLPLRTIEATARANAAYARNAGVASSSADKIVFLDADDQLAPGYLRAIADALEAHELVTSRVDSTRLNSEWVRAAHGPPWQETSVAVFFDFLPAAGVNIGVRRSLFATLGGFEEILWPSEDIAFSWAAQLAGCQLKLVSEAVYWYRYRDTLLGLYRQSRSWGTSNVALFRKFRHHGMPGRSLSQALREWCAILSGVFAASSKEDLAPLVVKLGYSVGRVAGSIRHQALYP
ncbi:MAG: glycosyltransferase [Acidobacteriota bacterium]